MDNYISQAFIYFRENKERVMFLINNDKSGPPDRPTLSDWSKPEIWKGSHWKWLLNHLKETNEIRS